MTARRDFLRGLVSLPLVGGSVGLIGRPSAVAEPITPELLYTYTAFCAWEHAAAYYAYEKAVHGDVRRLRPAPYDAPMFWFPEHWGVTALSQREPVEHRAALVLSAVGLDWRGRHGERQPCLP